MTVDVTTTTTTVEVTQDDGTTVVVQPAPTYVVEIAARGPQGIEGPVGPANTLTIGTVEGGDEAAATITGEAPDQTLSLVLPKGDKGDTGDTGATGPDRKSTRLNSSHVSESRMPSSA